jgi:hypothetical protein
VLCGAAVLCPGIAIAQGPASASVPAHVGAVLAYPAFFHARSVVLQGTIREDHEESWLETESGDRLRVVGGRTAVQQGRVELQGTVYDIGRVAQGDARVGGFDLAQVVARAGLTNWPQPGELVIVRPVVTSSWRAAVAPSARAIALDPGRYGGERVTVSGQFRGHNLFGELPAAPGRHRWEFVIADGAAAVWVVGLRPRGDGFSLDVDARVDSTRWFTVSGIVHHEKGLVWIEGQLMTLASAPQAAVPAPPLSRDPQPAPTVTFSVPIEGEDDVPVRQTVRIQFSRPIAQASIEGRVRVSYRGEVAGDPVIPAVTATYAAGDRVLTLTFAQPLGRFRPIRVDLLDGIVATDGVALKPWSLTFTTGG